MFFFYLRLNKRLSKQPWSSWFETSSWSLWRRCNDQCGCPDVLPHIFVKTYLSVHIAPRSKQNVCKLGWWKFYRFFELPIWIYIYTHIYADRQKLGVAGCLGVYLVTEPLNTPKNNIIFYLMWQCYMTRAFSKKLAHFVYTDRNHQYHTQLSTFAPSFILKKALKWRIVNIFTKFCLKWGFSAVISQDWRDNAPWRTSKHYTVKVWAIYVLFCGQDIDLIRSREASKPRDWVL